MTSSQNPTPPAPDQPTVLVVDMDGTLLATDTLLEGFIELLTHDTTSLPRLLGVKNRLQLKQFLDGHSSRQADLLPLNEEVVSWCKKAHAQGTPIYLATASSAATANAVARRFPFFKGIFCSSQETNLKGKAKADVLCQQFGKGQFDYIGDSLADVPVWTHARKAIVALPSAKIVQAAKKANPDVLVLSRQKPTLRTYAKLLRLHQWVKNLLVFAPPILAHDWQGMSLLHALLAFFSLCFCASAIYVVNDALDVTNDRRHPRKKHRPFASGRISLWQAPFLFGGCLFVSALCATFLPAKFFACLLVYLLFTLAYSFFLKKKLFIDVILLALLYMLRIIAGALALDMSPSNWLLAFAGFFFLGLALLKRVGASATSCQADLLAGRAYRLNEGPILGSMAISSGFCAIVVITLYIDSLQALHLYAHPLWLWGICPLLAYWYGRLVLLVHRGEASDDPVNFSIRDKKSYLVLALMILIFLCAM